MPGSHPDPATIGRRLGAALVDVIATLGVLAVAWLLVRRGIDLVIGAGGLDEELAVNALPFALLGILLVGPWLYWAGLEAWTVQGTIGKAALGLRVRTPEGGLPRFGRTSRRYWTKAMLLGPLLPFGLLALAVTALLGRRPPWDLAAGTRVVCAREPGALYELPSSTLIIPSSTRTGKVSTGS